MTYLSSPSSPRYVSTHFCIPLLIAGRFDVIPADLPEPDAALPPAVAAIEEALEETLSLVRAKLGAP